MSILMCMYANSVRNDRPQRTQRKYRYGCVYIYTYYVHVPTVCEASKVKTQKICKGSYRNTCSYRAPANTHQKTTRSQPKKIRTYHDESLSHTTTTQHSPTITPLQCIPFPPLPCNYMYRRRAASVDTCGCTRARIHSRTHGDPHIVSFWLRLGFI